jgi:hypothetical protein
VTAEQPAFPREDPPVMAGHVWRNYLGDAMTDPLAHQFSAALEPDGDDILTTLCGRDVMAFRVLADSPRPPFCIHCILATGRRAAAEQDAAWNRRVAAFGGGST